MGKKVLILSASPRRGGNLDLLFDQFMRGVKELGHQVDKFFLQDKEINLLGVSCLWS
jgi:multimeric flavodoxin WrbA